MAFCPLVSPGRVRQLHPPDRALEPHAAVHLWDGSLQPGLHLRQPRPQTSGQRLRLAPSISGTSVYQTASFMACSPLARRHPRSSLTMMLVTVSLLSRSPLTGKHLGFPGFSLSRLLAPQLSLKSPTTDKTTRGCFKK